MIEFCNKNCSIATFILFWKKQYTNFQRKGLNDTLMKTFKNFKNMILGVP